MSEGLRIAVRLSPKASRDEIQGWIQDENGNPVLKVSVTAVPEKGRANKALVALLAKSWKLPNSAIVIIKGETDRNKTLIINGISTLPGHPPSQ